MSGACLSRPALSGVICRCKVKVLFSIVAWNSPLTEGCGVPNNQSIGVRGIGGELMNNGSGKVEDMGWANELGYLKLAHRFLGACTRFELRSLFATAESSASGKHVSLLPRMIPRARTQSVGNLNCTRRLTNDVDNLGLDFSLRGSRVARFGGVSAGCAFRYLAIEQACSSKLDKTQLFVRNSSRTRDG